MLVGDLLIPIVGNSPGGENLRYAPVYEKIKEARRKEDPVAQGDWQRALKEADYRLVVKLCTDVLKGKSKDLQVAAWLTEALAYQEGLSGVKDGLDLLRGLLENFWDTVYPEIEDGDLELRAAPLSWVGEYRELEVAVRSLPVTKSGFSWLKYKESRTVGYEADLGDSDSRRQARSEAINEGKLTAEEFDADVSATALADLDELVAAAGAALESLQLLDELCQEKFGDDASSFRILRLAIEDVQHMARILAAGKREKEPQPEPEPEPEVEEAETPVEEPYRVSSFATSAAAAAAPARARTPTPKPVTAEPVDRDDAIRRIAAHAAYLRRDDPYSPVPYLILRGLRWGELRASTDQVNPDLLEAPSSEIRQQVKRHMMDGAWENVLETAESAMALPCGRGWLDLQRYVVRACAELGSSYDAIASAIRSELRTLLKDWPQLPAMTLLDDTATANAETQSWLAELFPPDPPAAAENREETEILAATPLLEEAEQTPEAVAADPYELAVQEARSGNAEQAMQILAQKISQERSGRGRFLRRMQMAQICIFLDRHSIAYPILQDLAHEIDSRKLDCWEQPEAVAQTLALLFECMRKLEFGEDETQKIYSQICRLDPVQAARLAH
jgi:type VI secretion system protein ImpA